MGYVSLGEWGLHYEEWGTGSKLLLAFHGYAESASTFHLFGQYLGKEYTILAFGLPHHGASTWKEDMPFTIHHLSALVRSVKTTYNVNKISVMGYSIGGRICLSMVAAMPETIDKVLLMGADGLAVNGNYYLLTRTRIGKFLFKWFLRNPKASMRMNNALRNLRLISAARHKLVAHSLRTEEQRKLLLQVWPGLSSLLPKPRKVKAIIAQYRVPIVIYMGAYDKLLPPKLSIRFAQGLDTVKVFILKKGHKIFDKDNAQEIAQQLL